MNFGNTNSTMNKIMNQCNINCYEVNLMFFLSIISLIQYVIFGCYFLYVNKFLIIKKDDYNSMIKDTKYRFFMVPLLYFFIYYTSMMTNNFYIYYIYSIIFTMLQPYMSYKVSKKHNIIINIINDNNVEIFINDTETDDESDDESNENDRTTLLT